VQERYQGNKGYEINYSFPIGSYLIELLKSQITYKQEVIGFNDSYLSQGETIGDRLKVSKILYRNQNNKYKSAISVYHKDSKNYFEKSLIEVSSYKTTLAQLDLIHTYLQTWGQLQSTLSYYEGKDWFGAKEDEHATESNQPKLEFNKISLNLNLINFFTDRTYNTNSTLHIQQTADYLYNNDKLTVGSNWTVRGYGTTNLAGNNGWYLKNDLIKTYVIKQYPKLLQTISPFIGMDYGKIKCEFDNEYNCDNIYSASIGLRANAKNLKFDITHSKPLKEINQEHKLDDRLYYNITMSF
jgi:hemolysin activation/secretion protein